MAKMTLWSIVESGIGIIAGSLHTLRKLFLKPFDLESSACHAPAHITPYTGANRAVITTSAGISTRQPHNDTANTIECAEVGSWEVCDDAVAGRRIHVRVDLEMQSVERPPTARTSHGSRAELMN